MTESLSKTKLIGRYIVTDPNICHGKPTFRGTRLFVADVLEQVANGMVWESIIEDWHGSITKEAIAEAVQLASHGINTEYNGSGD
ncbi:MAG: antitoxin [Candidatus Parabeggiatoa sp. nov. 3]|nr:MAG: antitoxin [Gammaproteobacteria bacterium]RKZ67775.1 MAG: antitoxin [Gammaproteobacteria bacterium]